MGDERRASSCTQHNHTDEFRFATDQPSVRVYDAWIGESDPRLVHPEMDIYLADAQTAQRSAACLLGLRA